MCVASELVHHASAKSQAGGVYSAGVDAKLGLQMVQQVGRKEKVVLRIVVPGGIETIFLGFKGTIEIRHPRFLILRQPRG
jgi:hypothetical protein